MKRLAILGATGSIGASTLDVVARHPERYRVVALAAHGKVEALADLCARFRPRYAAVADASRLPALREALAQAAPKTQALGGPEALATLASEPDIDCLVAAIVGAAGLPSTLAGARAGKQILLANKEALVLAGPLLRQALVAGGGSLIPIDSEHNAIFQCLPPGQSLVQAGVTRLLLTASGGPFRGRDCAALAAVTPEQAVAHPNWQMGAKISVDSATLMNKGLEVIEAHWLFDAPASMIEVVIHPQSVVHSLVQYRDGSVLAQLGNPDMRTAIAHALAWPERIDAGVAPLDLRAAGRLDFEAPDLETFRCLGLAYRALAAGGTAATILNAANEIAVARFLAGGINFLAIPDVIEACLDSLPPEPVAELGHILAADARARAWTEQHLGARS